MKNYLGFLLLCFSYVFQNTLPAQEYLVSLKGKELNIIDNSFEVTELIDARKEKCCIGYVYGGYQDTKWIVNIEGGVQESLTSFFKSGFKHATGQIPLIIKLNRLFVYEVKSGDNQSFMLEINMDFYTKENDTYFHEFTAGHYIHSYGENPKKDIDKMIAKALVSSCAEFLGRMEEDLGYHQTTNEITLRENSLNAVILAQSRSSNQGNCIYYTFNGFRDNVADSSINFYPKNVRENYDILGYQKFKFESTVISTDLIWGVLFNKQLYIQIDGVFIPVKETGNDYLIDNMISFDKDQIPMYGAAYGFVLFGAIGGAIIGVSIALAKDNVPLDLAYKLDMATGMPIAIGDQYYREYVSEMIFFTESYKDQNLELFINGKKVCSFQPESYFSYFATPDMNPMEICLKTESDEYCETLSSNVFNTMFFEATVTKKGQTGLFLNKSPSIKSYIINLIEKGKMAKINPEN